MCTSNTYRKAGKAAEVLSNSMGITVTDANENQYFVIKKTRIKITEHFADNGKPIDELMTDLIQAKIKEKAAKTA